MELDSFFYFLYLSKIHCEAYRDVSCLLGTNSTPAAKNSMVEKNEFAPAGLYMNEPSPPVQPHVVDTAQYGTADGF